MVQRSINIKFQVTLINVSRILKGAFEASLRVRDWSIKQKSVPTGTPEVHQCQGWSELQVTSRVYYVRLSFSLFPTLGIPTSLLTDCPCRSAYRHSKKSTKKAKTVSNIMLILITVYASGGWCWWNGIKVKCQEKNRILSLSECSNPDMF